MTKQKIGKLPEGFGFLVPAVEGRAMLACTFVHRKFLGRTPPGKAVFRAFLGGMKREALLAESDEALVATVRREMSEILGAKTFSADVEPEHAQVSRWRRAMAQYAVGHRSGCSGLARVLAELPGLRLVGNAYDGIGVPDCIRLGRQAARELVAAVRSDCAQRDAIEMLGAARQALLARILDQSMTTRTDTFLATILASTRATVAAAKADVPRRRTGAPRRRASPAGMGGGAAPEGRDRPRRHRGDQESLAVEGTDSR